MRTTAEVADEAMRAFTLIPTDRFDDDETRDVEEVSAAFIREQIIAALDIDRGERSLSIVHDGRDVEVGVWPAHPEMKADGGPEAIVVQVDTGEATGRIRINLNDAPIWDGATTDKAPGAYFDLWR